MVTLTVLQLSSPPQDILWRYGNADTLLFVQLTSPTIDSAYSSVALHPDGQILGTGTDDAVVHVWETRSQNVRHNCASHFDAVGGLACGCA